MEQSSKKTEESKKEFDDGYQEVDYIYEDDEDGGYPAPDDDEDEVSDDDSVVERESTASSASFVSAKEHLTVDEGGKRWFNKLGVKSEEAPKTIRIKSSVDKNHVKVESTESEYAVINRPSRKPSKTGQKGKA